MYNFKTKIIILIAFSFTLINCNNEPKPTQLEEVISVVKDSINIDLTQYPSVQHLINPNQLQTWLKDTSLHIVLLDTRPKEGYDKGHLKNAQLVERKDIASQKYPYTGMMLEKEGLATLLGKLGATAKSKIILYDDAGNVDAARLLWMLIIYGHNEAYLLNGGISNIQDSSFITKDLAPVSKPNKFIFEGKERMDLLASKEDVLKALEDENVFLLDCRTVDEFSGKTMNKGAFRAGHIPKAVNIEHSESIAYERGNTFRDLEDLKERFKLVPRDKKIITYCQSGVRSAHLTFVLKELMGYENVSNYGGSWIEWSYHKDLPIITENIN